MIIKRLCNYATIVTVPETDKERTEESERERQNRRQRGQRDKAEKLTTKRKVVSG